MKKTFLILAATLFTLPALPQSHSSIDSLVRKLMDTAQVTGLCLGIVEDNQPAYVQAYGYKNKSSGTRNDTATVFYAASFAKAVFACTVLHLVDQGLLNLDKPLYTYLPKPIPEYDNYKDLAGDDRWKLLTARICLDHTTGFPNFRWFNPRGNNKLEFFDTPGTHYGYSGEGLVLLELVVETITGKSLETLARQYVFDPFGMSRTSYVWQPAFESDYAVGHLVEEDTIPKKKRTKPNAAGSMETTIADFTRFVAAVLQGAGLSPKTWEEMTSPQISIYSKHQFPSLDAATDTTDDQRIGLAYGLGWGLFSSQYGKVFFKEGHDDGWENLAICIPSQHKAVVVMTNSSNGESIFKELFFDLTGITIPWEWESYTPYRPTVRVPDALLHEYAGDYTGKYTVSVHLSNGRLVAESADAQLPPSTLYATSDRKFFLKTTNVEAEFGPGTVTVKDDSDTYTLTRLKDTVLDPSRLDLFVGTYQANPDHGIVITRKKGSLYAQGTNPRDQFPKMEMHAYSAHAFYMKEANLKISFTLDDQGRPIKLVTFGSHAPLAEWRRVTPP